MYDAHVSDVQSIGPALVGEGVTRRGIVRDGRPWRSLLHARGSFDPVLGLRVALAWVGPMIVAHVAGQWNQPAALMGISGFLGTLVLGSLPSTRQLLRHGPGLALMLPLAVVPAMVATGLGHVGLLVATAWAVGLAPLARAPLPAYLRAFGIGVLLSPEVPATWSSVGWMVVGGILAVAIAVATQPLRRRWPARPPAVRTPDRVAVHHHAVRLAVAIGIAGLAAWALGDRSVLDAHSLWIGIGVWVVLQPYLDDTVVRGAERAVGTLAGGGVTILLVHALPDGVWIGWLFLLLVVVAMGARSLNYAWYCVAVTPVIVIGFGPVSTDLTVLGARVLWTAIGAALAVAVRLVLWPTSAHEPPAGQDRSLEATLVG